MMVWYTEELSYTQKGHMEKQETEMKRKRNGNWKWKWKLEIETGNGNENKEHTNHWCNVFFIVWLVITPAFFLSTYGYRTGFAFTPVLCFVMTVFSVIEFMW